MTEHDFPYSSLIGGWYTPNNVCDDLIELYKNADSKDKMPGKTFNENQVGKKSTDLTIPLESTNHPIIKNYFIYLQKSLENYLEKYPIVNTLEAFDLNEPFNIQYYKPNEGFGEEHFEHCGSWPLSRRCLVFMTYLNDVPKGGTVFPHQQLTSPAKKGLTMIWPAFFTHSHKGQIANAEKYIITGWYSFNDKDKLRGLL